MMSLQGEIRFDGVDIRKIYIEDLRRSISLCYAGRILFSDTIKSNVKLGAKTFSMKNALCHNEGTGGRICGKYVRAVMIP